MVVSAPRQSGCTSCKTRSPDPLLSHSPRREAILQYLEAHLHAVKGQVFNVGCDDQNYQIAQLGDLIKELIPDAQVIHQGEDVDKRNYRVSFGKIQKHLGFIPRRTVADGILHGMFRSPLLG